MTDCLWNCQPENNTSPENGKKRRKISHATCASPTASRSNVKPVSQFFVYTSAQFRTVFQYNFI